METRSGPSLLTAHLCGVRVPVAFSFGRSHPKPAFHTRVARKGIGFRQKRGFAPGIMDSCSPASAVRILNGVLGWSCTTLVRLPLALPQCACCFNKLKDALRNGSAAGNGDLLQDKLRQALQNHSPKTKTKFWRSWMKNASRSRSTTATRMCWSWEASLAAQGAAESDLLCTAPTS